LRPLPSRMTGLPRLPDHLSDVPCPLPRRIKRATGLPISSFLCPIEEIRRPRRAETLGGIRTPGPCHSRTPALERRGQLISDGRTSPREKLACRAAASAAPRVQPERSMRAAFEPRRIVLETAGRVGFLCQTRDIVVRRAGISLNRS